MIVRESINFERGQSPMKAMSIGKEAYEKFTLGRMILALAMQDSIINNITNRFFKLSWDNIYWLGTDWLLRENPQYENQIINLVERGKLIKKHSHLRHYTGAKALYEFYETEVGKILLVKDSFTEYFGTLSVAGYLRIDQVPELREKIRESVSFQRGMSDREIRDTLVGWRTGQFLINPFIGHLRIKKTQKNPMGKPGFEIYDRSKLPYKNYTGLTYRPKNQVRPLTNREREILRPYLTQEYINKLETELDLKILVP